MASLSVCVYFPLPIPRADDFLVLFVFRNAIQQPIRYNVALLNEVLKHINASERL